MSDSFDQRVLTTYLEEYFGDFLFDTFQPFRFYTGRDGDSIGVPPTGPRETYVKAIDALPLVQSPEVGFRTVSSLGMACCVWRSGACLLMLARCCQQTCYLHGRGTTVRNVVHAEPVVCCGCHARCRCLACMPTPTSATTQHPPRPCGAT